MYTKLLPMRILLIEDEPSLSESIVTYLTREGYQCETACNKDDVIDKTGGSGLGLSIVKKICELHGWKLNYDFASEKHLFRIAF